LICINWQYIGGKSKVMEEKQKQKI